VFSDMCRLLLSGNADCALRMRAPYLRVDEDRAGVML
jgi:hypothetical protein